MRTAQKFLFYVDYVGEGDKTRSQAAEHFAVSKSTATYHLERAVSEGYLERFYSWTDEYQTGWAYRKPSAQLPMPFEGMAEIEPPDLLDQLFEDGSSALDLDTWAEVGTGEVYEDIYDHQGLYSHTTVRDARWEID